MIFISCIQQTDKISIVDFPDTTSKNVNYISNRKPQKARVLIKLPVGLIVPDNWLQECLERESTGLACNF